MSWGSQSDAKFAGTGGFQSPPKNELPSNVSRFTPKDPDIVFFTSDDVARFFCHNLCDHVNMKAKVVRVAHNATKEETEEIIEKTALIVIATCRQSLDIDSLAQNREKLIVELARARNIPIVILAGENHEACQNHLALVRGASPLVIVPVHGGHFGEGFMECFPPRTQFVERGDSEAHIAQITRELLKRSR